LSIYPQVVFQNKSRKEVEGGDWLVHIHVKVALNMEMAEFVYLFFCYVFLYIMCCCLLIHEYSIIASMLICVMLYFKMMFNLSDKNLSCEGYEVAKDFSPVKDDLTQKLQKVRMILICSVRVISY